MGEETLICCACEVPMEPRKATFHYLGHHFFYDLHTCPSCGQVFIPEDLVRGKMREVETELEDK